jgi:ketosteroid isomerase-like protein
MSDAATNKSIVRRFLGAVQSGDLETIEALQAPDCTWWVVGGGDMTRGEYTDAVNGMLLTASTRKVEIIGIIAEGDTVAAEVRSEMHFGDRVYTNEYHDLFILRDGLIVHGREYFDTVKVVAFFGPQGG